jgi:hypothetical protein
MSRLLILRQENRSRRRKLVFASAVATCVVIAAVITVARYQMQ